MMLFTGQTAKIGHFLQPTAIAMGHSVMADLGFGRTGTPIVRQLGRLEPGQALLSSRPSNGRWPTPQLRREAPPPLLV